MAANRAAGVFLASSLLLTACASGSKILGNIATPTGTRIDEAAYNRMLAKQGLAYWCPNKYCDHIPTLIEGYAPAFPTQEYAQGLEGEATIVFSIMPDGRTFNFRIESATTERFADAAIEALKYWRFKPATLRGKPLETYNRIQFPFQFADPVTPPPVITP